MLEQSPKSIAREEDILQLYQRPPIITSFQTGWQGFGLAYMCQPPGEVPEVSTPRWHSVGIFTHGNRVIHADRKIDGRKQRDAVIGGDITITPANIGQFHALEFDVEGKAILANEKISKPLVKPLQLFFQGDFIWTYANEKPKLPIPDILEKLLSQYRFIGSTKEVTIKAPFIDALEINHDLNHAKATHRELFRINTTKVDDFQDNGYYSVSKIRHFRTENTLQDYLQNLSLLFSPKILELVLENYFPYFVIVYTDTLGGKAIQVFAIYPETETTTRTFIPIFVEKSFGIFNPILEKSFIKVTEEVIYQDRGMLESLYPRFEAKIRLENEEPVHWVRKHYESWNKNNQS